MSEITLVTGGAGFVGKALVQKLRAAGERVLSFDLAPPEHVDDRQGSVTDPQALAGVMGGVTSVFHLAGNAQLWARDATVFDQINYQGTQIVADATRLARARLVHCSSLTTLVGRETPIGPSVADEDSRIAPADMLGAYPKSKRKAEQAVEDTVKEGLDGVIAIPTEPLGPGDETLTPPTRMILDFANGKTPAFIDCILNFVPVESLADGLIAARDRGRRGERYLLGGENMAMADLLAMIEKESGRPAPTTKMPYWVALAAGAIDTRLVAPITGKPPKAPLTGVRLAGRQVSFSSAKAEKQLNWKASPAGPALRETIRWFSQRKLLNPV
ncbi:MAG: NAD-dependent epimerase/dehydratase family protein [Pseudomonadota bacterium]